ncbi:MAG: DUF3604 domain-containing protein [Hellea sp.]|nr:DUF3604 domain-containing protein [Hellea sp.]
MIKFLKLFFLGLLLLIIGLFITYKFLSSITKHSIDKTVEITAPTSPKSAPERYAFGYQPGLAYTESRAPCRAQYPAKKAMWGDLHIHTALSADAYPDGTRTYPADVYRFAKGEEIDIPTPAGEPQRRLRLDRPLDFASVTDHAETFGEGYICRTKGAYPGYESKSCQKFRKGGESGVSELMRMNSEVVPKRKTNVCSEDGADCAEAELLVWQQTIDAAEQAYDRSADCTFTSFIGYEYTRAPGAQHMHRNTIFRNADVPERPLHHVSHPLTHQLLAGYEKECRTGLENCDVISIPHNSNISGGNAFNPRDIDGFSMETQMAYRAHRNAYDRLAEIVQHKGASECINGAADILGDIDELCDVEALRQFGKVEKAADTTTKLPKLFKSKSPDCTDEHLDPKDNLYKGFCLSSRDFARGALLEGMAVEAGGAANPFEFGFIGSTDTHISTSGQVDEDQWAGHIAYEADLEGRLGSASLGRHNRLVSNPGGLAGVYAVENSRDAIFQSMKRREAFATSGPRIEPRFFAGQFDDNICQQENWLELAYSQGTPMGSKLPAQDHPFKLLLQATSDPMSRPLEKLQLVKGWLSPEGHKHTKVLDLASGRGNSYCGIYEDLDYDPALPTYYYLRAVEPERSRWSAAQCAAVDEATRPQGCANDQPEMIREIAWSSPIWFTPGLTEVLPAEGEGHDGHK